MERFKSIDWLPAIEDMVEDVFIRGDRLERESVMYQILNGCFRDPLEDIDDEYEQIDLNRIRQLDPDLFRKENTREIINNHIKCESNNDNQNLMEQKNKRSNYIPGLKKQSFHFPKKSCLNKIQQATCLRALLRLTSNEKKAMTIEERNDLERYYELREKIKEEQNEFLEFAKKKWDSNFEWNIKCIKFVYLKWRAKVDKLFKLPNEYIEITNIPLTLSVAETPILNKDIKVKFVRYLKESYLTNITLPSLTQPYFLNINTDILLKEYLYTSSEKQHFKLPVSEDSCCENFAMNNKVDVVISSSGLKCLLNNIDPQYSNLWTIPVVVKSHNDRNVVYIDKRLPPLTATISQKNTWVYKYILRYHFVKNNQKIKNEAEDESEAESATTKDSTSDLASDENLSDKNLDDHGNDSGIDFTSNNCSNVSYKLFTIGPCLSSDYSKLMKEEMKEFHMLVRTKTDGVETTGDDKVPVMLEPKMEHQLELGAEAVTLEEGINQWMSLIFRPNTSIARVRIATDTAEIIQIDRLTTMSLSNEINMLYKIKVENSLCVLYNIIRKLSTLTPGRYILRHEPQHGAFAYVYKHFEECSANSFTLRKPRFKLHENWSSNFETATITPWPLLDTITTIPSLRFLKRMPAMFNPRLTQIRGRPKKHQTPVKASIDEPETKKPGRILRRRKRRILRKQLSGK